MTIHLHLLTKSCFSVNVAGKSLTVDGVESSIVDVRD